MDISLFRKLQTGSGAHLPSYLVGNLSSSLEVKRPLPSTKYQGRQLVLLNLCMYMRPHILYKGQLSTHTCNILLCCYFNTPYHAYFIILYSAQQMHNYFTNYYTPTCFDTIVSSSACNQYLAKLHKYFKCSCR
jgi:hypothetical protein